MLNISLPKSDFVGIASSGLCMIHCISTPFFFFATICSTSCCSAAPLWWQWLDFTFLFISLIAVYHSTKLTNSALNKFGLWSSWFLLLITILNIHFTWFYMSKIVKYIPSFSLIGLHLYNFTSCQCKSNKCF